MSKASEGMVLRIEVDRSGETYEAACYLCGCRYIAGDPDAAMVSGQMRLPICHQCLESAESGTAMLADHIDEQVAFQRDVLEARTQTAAEIRQSRIEITKRSRTEATR